MAELKEWIGDLIADLQLMDQTHQRLTHRLEELPKVGKNGSPIGAGVLVQKQLLELSIEMVEEVLSMDYRKFIVGEENKPPISPRMLSEVKRNGIDPSAWVALKPSERKKVKERRENGLDRGFLIYDLPLVIEDLRESIAGDSPAAGVSVTAAVGPGGTVEGCGGGGEAAAPPPKEVH